MPGPDSWTYPDLPGVVIKRENGKASSRWYYQGKNHRRTHPIPWDRKNKAMIRPLHRRFVAEIVGGSYEGRAAKGIERLEDAKAEFLRAQSKRLTPSSRAGFDRAFGYYLDVDMPLRRETIHRHIIRRLETPPEGRGPLATSTVRSYLMRIRSFGRWLVDARHLDASPMDGIAIPARQSDRKQLTHIFTPEEIRAVTTWYRSCAAQQTDRRYAMQNLEHAILIELVALLGMRPSEILRSRWEDVTPESWTVWGKAAPNRTGDNTRTEADFRYPRKTRDDHARKRHIPIGRDSTHPERSAWYARIRELLGELREYEEHHGGWLFGMQYTQVANRGLIVGLKAAGIDRRGRTFRQLRHSARWYMEERLRIDDRTIADILGHSVATSIRDYRTAPDADTIAERLKE